MVSVSERGAIGEVLEQLVDEYGLAAVLERLGQVCGETAEHLRANWGDRAGACAWGRAGRWCEQLGARCAAHGL